MEPPIRNIVRLAGELMAVPEQAVVSHTRDIPSIRARQATYLRAKDLGISLYRIGKSMGRDHSTVRAGIQRAHDLLERDPEFAWLVEQLRAQNPYFKVKI